jgi:hypothetical protein
MVLTIALGACGDGATVSDMAASTADMAVASAQVSCAGSACTAPIVCCLGAPGAGSAVTETCKAAAECVAGSGGYPLVCDGPEDCGASGVCCVSIGDEYLPDAGISKLGPLGNVINRCDPVGCPGLVGVDLSGQIIATSRACHTAADCTGLKADFSMHGAVTHDVAYDGCCTRPQQLGHVRFCAPVAGQELGLYSCN